MSNQLVLTSGFYLQGATSANLGGTLSLTGFVQGKPVFTVAPASNVVTTTQQTNVLTPQSQTTRYVNNFGAAGTVTFTLPTPSPSQQLSISNDANDANMLVIEAPAGTKIRFTDDQLYATIESSGNSADNITLIGESAEIWRVTYAGESSQGSAWTPQT
jgi:hypothetical protein